MSRLKDTLPNEQALDARLDAVLQSGLADFLSATDARRTEVVQLQNLLLVLVLVIVGNGVFIFFFLGTQWYQYIIWLMLLCLLGMMYIVHLLFKSRRLLGREIPKALVPMLSEALNQRVAYSQTEGGAESIQKSLVTSKLMTIDNIEVQTDDAYEIHGDNDVSVHELSVWQKELNRNQQETRTEVFRGVLVIAELKQPHSAETFISTDGDRMGFAHRGFWENVLERGKVTETILEWNDFERDLHVASSNHTAAREVLTPDFMLDLHEWWQEHKLNMRISFIGNRMFVLLPEESIHLASATTSIKETVIKRHAWSILRPVWRALLLIEDIPRSQR